MLKHDTEVWIKAGLIIQFYSSVLKIYIFNAATLDIRLIDGQNSHCDKDDFETSDSVLSNIVVADLSNCRHTEKIRCEIPVRIAEKLRVCKCLSVKTSNEEHGSFDTGRCFQRLTTRGPEKCLWKFIPEACFQSLK